MTNCPDVDTDPRWRCLPSHLQVMSFMLDELVSTRRVKVRERRQGDLLCVTRKDYSGAERDCSHVDISADPTEALVEDWENITLDHSHQYSIAYRL